jgi:hypothetical protein
MSLPTLTQVVARLRRLRPSQMVAIVVLIVGAVLAPPLFANQSGWVWKDLSGLLPYRDGVRIDLLSANGGSWLVSDNERLYRVNGETMNDLTGAIRSKGISTISKNANVFRIYGGNINTYAYQKSAVDFINAFSSCC